MLIKTVAPGTDNFENIQSKVAEVEYDNAFVESLSEQVAKYFIHTVFTYDYESSSDAGDGRDDYYTEEEDLKIDISDCIIKDNEFFGVICESFDVQRVVSLDCPEAVIYHPKNYGGTNYHFYRSKKFVLTKKD